MSVQADVVVIGAGAAGLSAAVRLVDAGLKVVVLDQAPRPGGRATAFTDRETGERVDNGQHVLFGCYRETYALLDRLGTAALAPLQPRLTLTMAGRDGRLRTLACPDLTPPWHLVAGLLRWDALPLADRLGALRVGRTITRARRLGAAAVAARVPAGQTTADWLAIHRQGVRIRQWLWHPLALAALNQPPETAAAAPFVRVIGELFGPRATDAAVGLARVPLDELYALPAVALIERGGGSVHLRSTAHVRLGRDGLVTGVHAGPLDIDAPAVVSAVPWYAFGALWPTGVPPALDSTASNAAAMRSSPIVTINLWLDGPLMPGPFVGLVDGPIHWVFDKAALFGERAAHITAVASGADTLAAADNATVTRTALDSIGSALPVLRQRRVLRSVVVREHRATFSLAPGSPRRPDAVTALPGFFLAGDWTDTGLPATIEGAVSSGRRAAAAVLAHTAPRAPAGHNQA